MKKPGMLTPILFGYQFYSSASLLIIYYAFTVTTDEGLKLLWTT